MHDTPSTLLRNSSRSDEANLPRQSGMYRSFVNLMFTKSWGFHQLTYSKHNARLEARLGGYLAFSSNECSEASGPRARLAAAAAERPRNLDDNCAGTPGYDARAMREPRVASQN
jgi:hypothetical protein